MKPWAKALLILLLLGVAALATSRGRSLAWTVIQPHETVASRVAQFGPRAHERLQPAFARAGVTYPPKALTLVGLKAERMLEVYAGPHPDSLTFITAYPVKRASGSLGPKLREGDYQVPEGIYGIESLNPNSRFHLALRVGYPNAFDRQQGQADGRTHLGGDIMIHGKAASVGCLAMGDPAAEDLFVLAAETGLTNIRVILSPVDFRRRNAPTQPSAPPWLPQLYSQIAANLKSLPLRSN